MHHLRVHGSSTEHPGPLSLSFEQVIGKLESLPRMFVELDGSFVWRHSTPWDGEVMDAAGRVQYVELRAPDGEPSQTQQSLRDLLCCFSDEPETLLIERVREGGVCAAHQYLRRFDRSTK